MPNSSGLITWPKGGVGVDLLNDVKSVLGENTNYLGRLCTSDEINMWAKFKSIDYDGWYMGDDDRSRIQVRSGGVTFAHGIKVPCYHDIRDFIDELDRNTGGVYYEYMRPTGYPGSPYRLLDFVSHSDTSKGYFHYANRPIDSARAVINQESCVISFDVNIQDDNQVKIHELVANGETGGSDHSVDGCNLGTYYLGAVVLPKGWTNLDVDSSRIFISSSRYNTSGGSTLSIPRNSGEYFRTGTEFSIYPFLSRSSDPSEDKWICPIEGVTKLEVEVGANYTLSVTNVIWSDSSKSSASLNWSVTSNVDNFRVQARICLVNASTKEQYGQSSNYDFTLNSGQTGPSNLQRIVVIDVPSTSKNYQFMVMINDDVKYFNIMSTLDS